jgi:hypothetical protein
MLPISATGASRPPVRAGDCADVAVNGRGGLDELEDCIGLGDGELGELEDCIGLQSDGLADVGGGVGDVEVTGEVTANSSA